MLHVTMFLQRLSYVVVKRAHTTASYFTADLQSWLNIFFVVVVRSYCLTLSRRLEGKVVRFCFKTRQISHLKDSTNYFKNWDKNINFINEKEG